MNVCMLVYNTVTRDNRVIREAETLQAAGHSVTIVGIPDNEVSAPEEHLPSGVVIRRVVWKSAARRRLVKSTPLRAMPTFALIAVFGWLTGLGIGAVLTHYPHGHDLSTVGLVALCVVVLLGLIAWAVAASLGWVASRLKHASEKQDALLRNADELLRGNKLAPADFPKPKTLIPDWVPEWALDLAMEPVNLAMGRLNQFVYYRYRSEAMAALAISLKPDVVHAHDCLALPTGVIVKRALQIPLVYDAHEIYEAAAARRVGVTDYYTRIHRKYAGEPDGFITVNESIATFYRCAYPQLPPAVVVRNATRRGGDIAYDGRLHDRAGVPRGEKILLYQGGYTLDRGLPMLVEAGTLLPEGWTLVMMGWGPLSDALRKIAASGGEQAARKIRFIPAAHRDELQRWTAGATAGIIPYENTVLNHWFCSPNKLWEYPSSGVPLIVQPFPELKKVIETYRCGWLLPEDLNPRAIANLIAGLSDAMIAEARAGCRAFLHADNWDSLYANRLIDLYKRLMASRAGADYTPHAPDRMAAQ